VPWWQVSSGTSPAPLPGLELREDDALRVAIAQVLPRLLARNERELMLDLAHCLGNVLLRNNKPRQPPEIRARRFLAVRPSTIVVHVHDAIETKGMSDKERESLCNRVQQIVSAPVDAALDLSPKPARRASPAL